MRLRARTAGGYPGRTDLVRTHIEGLPQAVLRLRAAKATGAKPVVLTQSDIRVSGCAKKTGQP